MSEKKDITKIIIDAVQDKKGTKISYLDLSEIPSSPAPEFLICNGKTPTQTSSIAENIIDKLREDAAMKPITTEGFRNAQWIILDYGSIMIHVFTPEMREFYNLEDLWSDGKITEIPDLD